MLTEAHARDVQALGLAMEADGVSSWSPDVETDGLDPDETARRLWAISVVGNAATFKDLSVRIRLADRVRMREAFHATRSVSGGYEIAFRIFAEGVV